jgi:hypothetical protein
MLFNVVRQFRMLGEAVSIVDKFRVFLQLTGKLVDLRILKLLHESLGQQLKFVRRSGHLRLQASLSKGSVGCCSRPGYNRHDCRWSNLDKRILVLSFIVLRLRSGSSSPSLDRSRAFDRRPRLNL